jgi:hypothetical protein
MVTSQKYFIYNKFLFYHSICYFERFLPEIDKYTDEYNKSDKALKFAVKWKETLENQRKVEVQTIYNSIKEQINSFYCRLHPRDIKCELVGGINLCVKDTGGGSALLQAGFHNKIAEDPRGYYSESHLDTLGLCIFLALYKKEADKNNSVRLLILDDVLTSVDAPHRKQRRVAKENFTLRLSQNGAGISRLTPLPLTHFKQFPVFKQCRVILINANKPIICLLLVYLEAFVFSPCPPDQFYIDVICKTT